MGFGLQNVLEITNDQIMHFEYMYNGMENGYTHTHSPGTSFAFGWRAFN